MSSSVFFECTAAVPKATTADVAEAAAFLGFDEGDGSGGPTADANLVVVYGKNTINFDRKGIESLIAAEDKTLSSISVIRLTSPTPSMEAEDEQEEAEKLKELSSNDDGDSGNEGESAASGSEHEATRNKRLDSAGTDESCGSNAENTAKSADEENDSSASEPKPKRRGRKKKVVKNVKTQKLKRRLRKYRPEIVGLSVEDFYPTLDANALLKAALKKAGITTLKQSEEYKFQLYVIKNDHCYTPFTSPEQMKAQLALNISNSKADAAEKQTVAGATTANRKSLLLPASNSLLRQHHQQRSLLLLSNSGGKATKAQYAKYQRDKDLKATKQQSKQLEDPLLCTPEDLVASQDDADELDDDEDEVDLDDEEEDESEMYDTEESVETDNDRDSDLDFNINNRKGRKRKLKLKRQLKKAKRATAQQQAQVGRPPAQQAAAAGRRQQAKLHSQDEYEEPPHSGVTAQTPQQQQKTKLTVRLVAAPPTVKAATPGAATTVARQQTLPTATMTTAAATSSVTGKRPPPPSQSSTPSPTQPGRLLVRRGPIVQVGRMTKLQPGLPRTGVKEIVINKVLASPKGGFTSISSLLAQRDVATSSSPTSTRTTPAANKMAAALATTTTPPRSSVNSTTALKCFTPLALEAAAKHQLPVQISLQTHQSSSELLAAEHDKQLDLIDSIVKNELKCAVQHAGSPAAVSDGELAGRQQQCSSANENIPELVKMLESTERALEQQKQLPGAPLHERYAASAAPAAVPDDNVDEDVDVLDSNDAVLSDMAGAPLPVDDIPDDLLQHVVELIEDDKTLQAAVERQVFGSAGHLAAPPPLTPIFQPQPQQQQPTESITKSIIELNIATAVPQRPADGAPASSLAVVHAHRTPIQIVRGNGRVITLPPIEAPTTRAKRRAQTTTPTTSTGSSTPTTTAATGPAANILNSSNSSLVAFNESSMDSSLHSNSSFNMTSTTNNDASSISISAEKTAMPAIASGKRRISKEGGGSGASVVAIKSAKKPKRVAGKAAVARHESADDADDTRTGGAGDDDDPSKLWCICRQPHNNRFMICCDCCEDWFHGTCVNITKAMGLEMEQKSIDWTCPKCKEKKQRKITEMLAVKPKSTIEMPAKNNNSSSGDGSTDPTAAMTIPPASSKPAAQTEIKKTVSAPKHLEQQQQQPRKLSNAAPLVVSAAKKLSPPHASAKSAAVTTSNSGAATSAAQQPAKRIGVLNKSLSVVSQQKAATATTTAATTATTTLCIVCKKVAPSNKVYCSDDCIRRHAQNAQQQAAAASPSEGSATAPPAPRTTKLTTTPVASGNGAATTSISGAASKLCSDDATPKRKREKGLFEDLLLLADRKPKVERVNVFERRSGRLLTGANAPTTLNLKKWLQENPSYEVLQPGSRLAVDLERRHRQQQQQQLLLKTGASGGNPNQQAAGSPTVIVRQPSGVPEQPAKSSPTATRPITPKQQLRAYPSQVTIRGDKCVKPDGNSKEQQPAPSSSSSRSNQQAAGSRRAHGEPSGGGTDSDASIRLNVRRTLKEQLLQRIKDDDGDESTATAIEEGGEKRRPVNKLSAAEVEHFATQTEAQMYGYFNRDTGAKYRAKYRSLMFNIKDRKNRTLLAKISAREVTPQQLVRMSPEELASQELAQWRENEAKHQLEMITKSELDLLSCAKHYVLKTHKGEEVDVDMPPAAVDVACVLNNVDTGLGDMASGDSSRDAEPAPTTAGVTLGSAAAAEDVAGKGATSSGSAKEKHSAAPEERRKKSSSKEHHHHHQNHHHHHERHREKTRAHGSVVSKQPHQHQHHHSSSGGSHSRSRSRSRSRERQQQRQHKDGGQRRDKERAAERQRSLERDKGAGTGATSRKTGVAAGARPPLEAYSLIDQILESTKTIEQAANLASDRETMRPTPPPPPPPPVLSTTAQQAPPTVHSNDGNESKADAEQQSIDVYVRYAAHVGGKSAWQGGINMIDVASFQVTLHAIAGNCAHLGQLLPRELDVVGRIGPATVWDYIAKIRKSPNKEIAMVRLMPADASETSAYEILYEYLAMRQRLGVIKTSCGAHIKDFYIYPLGAGQQLPAVLQPAAPERPLAFVLDPQRPDVLIGIVIRVIGKRSGSSGVVAVATTSVAASSTAMSPTTLAVGSAAAPVSLTPPGSPKRKKRPPKDTNDEKRLIDIDAIIKAPIAAKTHKPASMTLTSASSAAVLLNDDDGNEPYSPGGGTDDDDCAAADKRTAAAVTFDTSANAGAGDEELKRKMADLNRKIAVREMEIAGLLNVEPGRYNASSTTTAATTAVLANISIPSNLSQILASIKSNKSESTATSRECGSATATPPPPPVIGSLVADSGASIPVEEEYNPAEGFSLASYEPRTMEKPAAASRATSRLAQLSEAELLRMVPDDMLEVGLRPPSVRYNNDEYEPTPPPPGV